MMIHIFVVDDDAANLQVAGHILRKNNMRVTPLNSGQALLTNLQPDALPDLILLDIKMPEMDGFETLRRLRKQEKELGINEIPVIFLTADDTADTEKLGFEAGVSDYIRKPFDPGILLRRVHNIISKEQRISTLRSEADTDKLTGFLNKNAAARVMSGLCTSDLGCLMMIDLDSFKLVNDLFGHKMGDNILMCFAAILRSTLPKDSQIGRIGGDEFVAFVSGLHDEETVAALTKQINTELLAKAKEMMGEDMDIPLGASIGAVYVPKYGDNYDALFKLADKMLYIVKKNGKHGHAIYEADAEHIQTESNNIHDIDRLSEILGERSIPNVALQLDKEAFSYVYRYIMRYTVRNQKCIYKVLFTLQSDDTTNEQTYKENCDAFGDHIRESLRKTDILMRSRFNQYFVLLTDIHENDIGIVIGNIMHRWEKTGGSGLKITYESEFVSIDAPQPVKSAESRIAVADGDEATLRLAGTALSKAGFRVSAMKSGRALLKYLLENTPDLILLDAALPDADSMEIMRQIRSAGKTVPIVVMTADEHGAAAHEALRLGAEDLLMKPLHPELLVHRIKRMAELSGLRRNHPGSRKE